VNNGRIRQVVNVLATLLVLVVNALANALPLNGLNTGQISDQFNVLFVPAGYVFSIWGLIYVGLIAFAVFQALPSQRDNPRLRRIGWWYAVGCLANSAWIFLWHYQVFVLTLVAMLVLLASLIAVYLRLDIGRAKVRAAEFWTTHVPFSIYLGWISVATIANVTDVLDYVGWGGWGLSPEAWAVLMLAAAGILTLAMGLTRSDAAYALVIAWAAAGIAIKQAPVSEAVARNAWVLAVVAALVAAASIVRRLRLAQAKG
jgi:hypothetical protein